MREKYKYNVPWYVVVLPWRWTCGGVVTVKTGDGDGDGLSGATISYVHGDTF